MDFSSDVLGCPQPLNPQARAGGLQTSEQDTSSLPGHDLAKHGSTFIIYSARSKKLRLPTLLCTGGHVLMHLLWQMRADTEIRRSFRQPQT